MKHIVILLVALVAWGCAPTVTGNEQSMVVTSYALFPDSDAFKAADQYCGARGKKAVLQGKRTESEFVFRCVP